jgi:hypothetical protein
MLQTYDAESGDDVYRVVIGKELKPYRKQKEWLSLELLHSAPEAEFCLVNGNPGAQLKHPLGGPLTWVRCPYKNVIGVIRVANKWHWLQEAP